MRVSECDGRRCRGETTSIERPVTATSNQSGSMRITESVSQSVSQTTDSALATVPLFADHEGVDPSPRVSCTCYGFPRLWSRLRRRLRLFRRDSELSSLEEEASCRCLVRGWGGCFLWQETRMPREVTTVSCTPLDS